MTEMISRINENTSIPLKVLVPVVSVVVAAAWALSSQISSLRSDLSGVSGQVRAVNGKIDGAWSVQNMQLWATKFQRDNPNLKIPSAREGMALER